MKQIFSFILIAATTVSLTCSAQQNIEHYAISRDAMLNRFMDYIAIESGSEESDSPDVYPMTEGQKRMAQKLAADAKAQHMGDALAAASTYIARVPLENRPENTEGKAGYIHPWSMERSKDKLSYTISTRIRYFDQAEGESFDRIVKENIRYVQASFPYVEVEIVRDVMQYDNVEYTMHPLSLPLLKDAAARCGLRLRMDDLRAGTTAAMFCAKGLRGGLSIFSGQHNEHSVQEYSVLEEMYDSYRLLLTMIDEAILLTETDYLKAMKDREERARDLEEMIEELKKNCPNCEFE